MPDRVLGVDACKNGWVGIVLGHDEPAAYFARDINELVSVVDAGGEVAVVAIDIPIGLPDAGRRQSDLQARRAIGPRRSSVFMTPVRGALELDEYSAALVVNQRLAGEGFSRQAFGLRTRIFEVDVWVRTQNRRVVEIHPEVSFARMAGAPLRDSKTTWAGVEQRRELLTAAGIRLAGDLGLAGRTAGVDDVLDAAAAAWSACRVATGNATSLPDRPERYSDGLLSAIWV